MLNVLNPGLTAGHWRRTILAAAILFSSPAFAFTFDVTTTNDAVDDNPGDGICHTAAGQCSLRAAVQEANAWPGADAIRLGAGPYTLSIAGRGEDNAATGDLDIRESVDIHGVEKATSVIDGGGVDRVFDILPGATVNIANVTIQNGLVTDTNDNCTAAYVSDPGAGIRNQGTLNINDSVLESNIQKCSGGGALANQSGSVKMSYTTVQANQAQAGAGINQNFGQVAIDHSQFYRNNARGAGGGIFAFNGVVNITDSVIDRNTGSMDQNGVGGGLANEGGSVMTVKSSLISGNTTSVGGGVNNCCGTSTVYLINSTIFGNTAKRGGGINSEYNTYIYNSTISANQATGLLPLGTSGNQEYGAGIYYGGGLFRLSNSILDANVKTTATNSANNCELAGGTISSLGNNIDSDGTCALSGSGDSTGTANLETITLPTTQPTSPNNGGSTLTQKPLPGSPAIDGGAVSCKDQNGDPLTTDQRGFSRPVDGNGDTAVACDVGAVEVHANEGQLADLAVHVTASADPIDTGDREIYTVVVANNGPATATNVQVTDTLPANTNFVNGNPSSGECTPSGSNVVCTAATSIAPGGSATFTIAADVTSLATGTLTNTAKVDMPGSGLTDPNAFNNQDDTAVNVNLIGDVQVSVTGTPNPAVLNVDTVTYTINVRANAGATVPNVVMTDVFPASAVLVANSSTTSMGTCTENAGARRVSCALGAMSPGQTATITLKVTPNAKGTMTDTAVVNFDGSDSNPIDNKASVDTVVQVRADLAVTANDIPNPVKNKSDLSYIVSVINNGPSPSSDVTLTATLPASGVDYGNVSSTRGTCSRTSNIVTCDLGGMVKNAQATVTLFVTPNALGPDLAFSATASPAGDETDPDTGNNTATTQTPVEDNPTAAVADLSIALSGSPGQVHANESVTYTLSVTNHGPEAADSVLAVLTNLPASVQVTSSSGSCAKDQLTVQVRCTLGTLNNGANGKATVTVKPTAAGVLNPTASVTFVGHDTNQANNTATAATTVTAAVPASTGGSGGGGGADTPLVAGALALLYLGARRRRGRGRR